MNKFLKILAALAGIILPLNASAQLTLEECQQLARDNYPLIKQYGLIEQTTNFSISNIKKGYLPQITFTGQASYQSDVTTLPEPLVNVMQSNGLNYLGLEKDQYRFALDINQIIWDGGNLSAQQGLATIESQVQTAQLDVALYAIRKKVNDLYFGILLIEDKIKLCNDLMSLLSANCQKIENLLNCGAATQTDLNILKAEYLNVRQDYEQLISTQRSFKQMLAIFIGKNYDEIVDLERPTATMPQTFMNQRPELNLYSSQLQQIDAHEKLLNSGIKPSLSLFAQGWYGYTGYNMFNDMFSHDFTLNGIIGVKLSWNISNLYSYKNNKEKLTISRHSIETAKDTFLFNVNLQSSQEVEAIKQYHTMMLNDEEIISLRSSVRQSAESKFEQGIIDVNDLLQEIIRENQARIAHSIHEIEMLRNIYELRNTINQ